MGGRSVQGPTTAAEHVWNVQVLCPASELQTGNEQNLCKLSEFQCLISYVLGTAALFFTLCSQRLRAINAKWKLSNSNH